MDMEYRDMFHVLHACGRLVVCGTGVQCLCVWEVCVCVGEGVCVCVQGSHSHGKSWKILEKKLSWKVMENEGNKLSHGN